MSQPHYSPQSTSRIQIGPADFCDFDGKRKQEDWARAMSRDRTRNEHQEQSLRQLRSAEQDVLRRALDAQIAMKRGEVVKRSATSNKIVEVSLAAEARDGSQVDARDREIEALRNELTATAKQLQEEYRRVITPRIAAVNSAVLSSCLPQPWNATTSCAKNEPPVDRSESICRSDNSPRYLRSTERAGQCNNDGLRFDGYGAYTRAQELFVKRQEAAVAVAPPPPPTRGLRGDAILPPALTVHETSRAAKAEAMRAGLEEQLTLSKKISVEPPPSLPMYDARSLLGQLTLPQTPKGRRNEQEAYRSVLRTQISLRQTNSKDDRGMLPLVFIKPNRLA